MDVQQDNYLCFSLGSGTWFCASVLVQQKSLQCHHVTKLILCLYMGEHIAQLVCKHFFKSDRCVEARDVHFKISNPAEPVPVLGFGLIVKKNCAW